MMKRRAKIRVKPVISSVSSSSVANEVEEAEKDVVASETPLEIEKQQQQQQYDTEDRIDNDQHQEIENNANEDSILEIGSETVPVESPVRFDESIVERLDQACNRLNSTVNNESSSHDNNSEKAPSFDDYISIPIIFGDRNDRPTSSRAESPKSTSTYSEEQETTQTSKTSILSKTFDRKRAAERLANKLVKKRVVEKPKAKTVGILSEPVNSSQLCMRDLIYLNPRDNPMSSSDAIEGRTVIKEAVVSEEPQQVEDLPVPRLEIGPDGKIVINEASLVIPQKSPNFNEMMVVDDTNYFFDGYKSKRPRSKKWGMKETKRFYAALSMIGTDFSLISKLLPNRTRDEIKNKFKSEDRKNRTLIDTALKVKKPLDISLLAEPPSDDDLIDEKPPKKKKEPKTKKQTNSQKKPQGRKENGNKSAKNAPKAPTRKRKALLFESSDEISQEAANDEVVDSSKLPERKRNEPKRRKIIDDDDSASANGEATVENSVDPYDFDEDTDVEYDIEITKFTQKRNTRIIQRARPSESPGQPSPEDAELLSLQEKFSQQLEQMEIDQKRSELKSIDEDDDSNLIPQDLPEGENIQEDCQKLFNQLPSTKKSRASINIIDHNSINLEELGIGEIPPNHKLVVVSTPLKEGLSEENDDSDQQLLQVFTISESALKSMMEDAKNSTFDPVEALLSIAHGQGINLSDDAQQDPTGGAENFDRMHDEDSHASSDIDASILDGLISTVDDFPSMLSPPMVQNELFLEDIKVLPSVNISEDLDGRPDPTQNASINASSEICSGAAS